MTKRKLTAILQVHPYLIDPAFVRSRSEAIRFVKKNGCSIEDFIDRCKQRSNLPPQAWAVFSDAIAKKNAIG